MLKRIAQAIVRKNNLDKFDHALKFIDCDGELVNEEVRKFEEKRPKTTFVVKECEKHLKNQERENEK
ncbi:MAG: hypothetical protein RI930_253 [Pseudomonadota bacterium]|jgi:hypothetical protein